MAGFFDYAPSRFAPLRDRLLCRLLGHTWERTAPKPLLVGTADETAMFFQTCQRCHRVVPVLERPHSRVRVVGSGILILPEDRSQG